MTMPKVILSHLKIPVLLVSLRFFGALLLSVLSLGRSGLVLAQVEPCFKADFQRGCSPLTVNFVDCSGADKDLIFYDFGDGPKPKTWNIYTEPGRYTVTQVINSGAGGAKLVKENYIEVIEPQDVKFSAVTCTNGSVKVSIEDERYDTYLINFGDGTTTTIGDFESAVHVYRSSGLVKITITGLFDGAANNCGSKTVELQVSKSFEAPLFSSLRTLDNVSAEFNYSLPDFGNYGIFDQGSPTSSAKAILNSTSKTLLLGLDNANTQATYFLGNQNACSDSIKKTNLLRLLWLNAFSEDGTMRLSWSQAAESPDFIGYELYKANLLLKSISDINQTTFVDIDLICNNFYDYRVEAVYADKRRAISQTLRRKATSLRKPPAPDSVVVSIENQKVKITFVLPDSLDLTGIQAAANCNSAAFSASCKGDKRFIFHHGNFFQNQCCYTLTSTDACGNVSVSTPEYCPILLKGIFQGSEVVLSRSDYVGFGGTTHFLQILDENDSILLEYLMENQELRQLIKDQKRQVLRYRIRGLEYPSKARETFSNIVELAIPFEIEIPNAFSPNNDGLNDTFAPIGNYVSQFSMEIFTKWGNKVFSSNDLNKRWDGTLNGQPLNTDTYWYVISLKDQRGISFIKKGEVQLLR